MSQQQQPSFPPRDVAASYVRQRHVASTLDLVVSELLRHQPDDPEQHILDVLLARRQEQQRRASDSSSALVHGTQPRHPMPPMTTHRRSSLPNSNHSHNINSNSNAAGGGAAPGEMYHHHSSSSSAVGGTSGAEELLAWVLNKCSSASSLSSSSCENKNQTNNSTTGSGGGADASSAQNNSNNDDDDCQATPRVPAGSEHHPLALRAVELVTRYLSVRGGGRGGGSADGDDEQHRHHHHHHSHHHRGPSDDEDGSHGLHRPQPGDGLGSNANILALREGEARKLQLAEEERARERERQFRESDTSLSPSQTCVTPELVSHLKTAFRLNDAERNSVLLAVTDAMQIILAWAGDPLLVADNLAGVVKLLINGDRCAVFVADETSQTLRTVIDGNPITVRYGHGIVGRCAVHKAPLVVNNAYSHPSFNPSVDSEVGYVTRNLLSVPMIVEGKLIAIVQVLNKKDGTDFSDVDVEIFKAFTAVAGIVVRDAMTFPQTLRNAELAEATKDLCTNLMRVNLLSEREAAAGWVQMLRGYLTADCCTLLKVRINDSDRPNAGHFQPGQLEFAFLASDSEIDFGGFQPLPQKAIIAASLSSRMPELVNSAYNDPRFDVTAARSLVDSGVETSSLLIVPLFPFAEQEMLFANQHPQSFNNVITTGATCVYVLQFENFRDAVVSNNNNNNNNTNNDNNGSVNNCRDARRESSSSQDFTIFSDEAVAHIRRILPFFEILLRHMSLIVAQRGQSHLLRETSRTVGILCEDKLDFPDMFDLFSRTVEHVLHKSSPHHHHFHAHMGGGGGGGGGASSSSGSSSSSSASSRGSVLFYAKIDSEGIDQLQLLPRASLVRDSHHPARHNAKPSFRLRRRSSIANLEQPTGRYSGKNDFQVPIGSGVVGTGVARSTTATYFTAEEVNEHYHEGEFGLLVEPRRRPDCPVLVVPLSDNKMLLGAMVILRPHHEIRERIIDATSRLYSNVPGSGGSRAASAGGQDGGGGGDGITSQNQNNNNVSVMNPFASFGGLEQSRPLDGPQSGAGGGAHSSSSAGGGGGGGGAGDTAGLAPVALEGLNWAHVTPGRLTQAARVDFLSVLISITKYVFKASNTITALVRQQEGILLSGELERLAMPTAGATNAGSAGHTGTALDATSSCGNVLTAAGAGGAGGAAASSSAAGADGRPGTGGGAAGSPSRMVNANNFSANFSFGNRNSASPLDTPLRPEMFDKLITFEFPIFEFVDGNQPATGLIPLTVHMFRSLNCLEELCIDEAVLSTCLLKAFRRYRDVPYHNVFHAFDVTQSTFLFMKLAQFDEIFEPAERFALLLGSVFHDIDHNGLNNAYHMKAETAFGVMASLSGQRSVLEYHHCQVAIDVINSVHLLDHTDEEQRRRILKIFFNCILSTDMAVHREIMQQLQTMFLAEDGVTRSFEPGNQDHRDLAMKMVLKMADISNPVKDFALARRWGLAVTEEFYQQGDVERQEGREVAPMNDRTLNTELSKGQIGFITFMASPFFNLISKCFEEFEVLSRNMEANLRRWQKVQEASQQTSATAGQ